MPNVIKDRKKYANVRDVYPSGLPSGVIDDDTAYPPEEKRQQEEPP